MRKHLVQAVTFVAVLALSVGLVAHAYGEMRVAKERAERQTEIADSLADEMAAFREQYEALEEGYDASKDSLQRERVRLSEVRARARAEQEDASVEGRRLRGQIADTAQWVHRELVDSILMTHDRQLMAFRDEIQAMIREIEALKRELAITEDRLADAEEGWDQSMRVNEELREAVERWRDAANPSLLSRISGNIGLVGASAVIGASLAALLLGGL